MLTIDYLAKHPDTVPTLANWFHSEWGYLYPERTLQEVEEAIAGRTNIDRVPLALVAHDGDELVGTVCLKVHDMDVHTDLTPWLAGLYVKSSRRGEGIGQKLVAAIEERAKEIGVKKLYLYTPESEGFYLKLGWSVMEREAYHDYPVSIMSKQVG